MNHRAVDGRHEKNLVMWLILLEALAALGLLLFIVWWTMFSGRRQDPKPPSDEEG